MPVNTEIPKETFIKQLMFAIKVTYEKESNIIVEDHKKQIEKELESLRYDIVHRASLDIRNRIKVSDFGNEITISIYKDVDNA